MILVSEPNISPILPKVTSDEIDPREDDDEERDAVIEREVPPHHGYNFYFLVSEPLVGVTGVLAGAGVVGVAGVAGVVGVVAELEDLESVL